MTLLQQALEALEGADSIDTDMAAAITALRQAIEAGAVVVPKEATYQMMAAGLRGFKEAANSLGRYTAEYAAYRAAIEAAPKEQA